jgi:hypothetical protein
MDGLCHRNAKNAERVHAMIFYDVSDADSIDDGTACGGDSGEPTDDLRSSEQKYVG